jgi:3-hydroxyacyl-CoA dehydrogenase
MQRRRSGGAARKDEGAQRGQTGVESVDFLFEARLQSIRRNYESSAKKGKLTEAESERRLSLLSGALDLAALAESDLVIEAVFEDMEVKRGLFRQLDGLVKKGAILATNTSYLDINEIASKTRRPQDVIGLHFFSPAHVVRLLEIVRGARTGRDVVATAVQLARKIGKIGVVVGVCYGFVGNRILSARQRQAAKLLAEGAMPWDVDRALTDFGFPMGPFAMSDMAGVDIGWLAAASSSSTIKEILCEMGRKGQKTRSGYYDYDEARKPSPSPVVEKLVLDFSASRGIVRRHIPDQEILERCLYAMINEGAKILEEGIALRASDIDVLWLNGYGWPAWRGGPIFYADAIGLDRVISKLEDFCRTVGPEFAPSPLLRELATAGRRLSGLVGGRG